MKSVVINGLKFVKSYLIQWFLSYLKIIEFIYNHNKNLLYIR